MPNLQFYYILLSSIQIPKTDLAVSEGLVEDGWGPIQDVLRNSTRSAATRCSNRHAKHPCGAVFALGSRTSQPYFLNMRSLEKDIEGKR